MRLVLAAALLAGAAVTTLPAQSAPKGVFDPAPVSAPLYGTKGPEADPVRQRHVVTAHDGVDLYVETWLPAKNGAATPPKRIPTVLIMTPYVTQGVKRYGTGGRADVVAWFTQRGYAVTQAHVRGTGESGGCLEQTSTNQIDDGARIVEYLGRDASWTNGAVGMYGISYDGETQISVAGLGDKKRTKYLKAIVPVESVSGQYEYSHFDGVPYVGQAALSNGGYLAGTSLAQGETTTPQQDVEKLSCQPEVLSSSVTVTGNMTPFWQSREYRGGASQITAATLHVHGLQDWNVQPIAISGLFDRLPASTPRMGLYGLWAHNFPDNHPTVSPTTARADWLPTVTAWYDRYLKGAKTGVESWPRVQVQASDGTWRAESDFPGTGGPVGQLALGPGVLGATTPTGSSAFVEGTSLVATPGSEVVFETPAVTAPLHLTGQPVLDLWLTTDRPDGHLSARIEVVDAETGVKRYTGTSNEPVATYGFRSLQHLQPITQNWFRQETAEPPALLTPLHVPVRFHPTDLVVPVGGHLRVTVAGANGHDRNAEASGTAARITVLHDCTHPSALRFLMARPDALRLDVRELGEERLAGVRQERVRTDGGLAQAKVCGKAPLRLDAFRATRDLVR